jgi:hypothetical protein
VTHTSTAHGPHAVRNAATPRRARAAWHGARTSVGERAVRRMRNAELSRAMETWVSLHVEQRPMRGFVHRIGRILSMRPGARGGSGTRHAHPALRSPHPAPHPGPDA